VTLFLVIVFFLIVTLYFHYCSFIYCNGIF